MAFCAFDQQPHGIRRSEIGREQRGCTLVMLQHEPIPVVRRGMHMPGVVNDQQMCLLYLKPSHIDSLTK